MDKLSKIKLVISDVDGVLTDSSITIDHEGNELKIFNARDGAGIKYLQSAGIKFAIISGRKSEAVKYRAKELNIEDVYQGTKKKRDAYSEMLTKYNLTDDETCYIGDDLIDIPLLKKVGYSVAVFDAVTEVKELVDYITTKSGGNGAVREVAEKILKKQDKWSGIRLRYL